jgi:3-methyladenine DNA glycosylase AlkD
MIDELNHDLQKLKNPRQAAILQRFFKTGKGEYAEGDVFLGINVPTQRNIAGKYSSMQFDDIEKLLSSRIHEERLIGLLILVDRYKKSENTDKEMIVTLYLKNTKQINNWDLVDLSAPSILGKYYIDKDKSILYKLAESDCIWERRISILSTFEFIKNNRFKDTLNISEILLNDKHDLIHKAVGWMLREIGKRDQDLEEKFLKKYYKIMPRTMLRYAIEKFNEINRKSYLRK